MAGLLGKKALAADIYETVAINGDKVKTVNIRLINRDLVKAVSIVLAICPPTYVDGDAPADEDHYEPPGVTVLRGGGVENTAVALSPGEKVVARASAACVTVRVHGM
ncbi:MAG: hypothetical protein H6R04_691 [Burkholderiaceae bacterium]|nr:hypothetical protein [Burkholderiaceae bacterium]